jgi:hypothetical protein
MRRYAMLKLNELTVEDVNAALKQAGYLPGLDNAKFVKFSHKCAIYSTKFMGEKSKKSSKLEMFLFYDWAGNLLANLEPRK